MKQLMCGGKGRQDLIALFVKSGGTKESKFNIFMISIRFEYSQLSWSIATYVQLVLLFSHALQGQGSSSGRTKYHQQQKGTVTIKAGYYTESGMKNVLKFSECLACVQLVSIMNSFVCNIP